MAFHPGYPADPRVYLSYTNATNGLVSRISEFRTRDGGLTLDPTSELILLTVPQPATNHNGGNIAFGPDGLLYVGFGDGGSGGDPWGGIGNGQNLVLLGKLLRIDVNGSTGTRAVPHPACNPYAGNALCNAGTGTQSCPEIYAYGLRNPWRWSFDRGSGELWVADVGQNEIEEVDRVVPGGNYGWRCFEGTQAYNSTCGPNAGSALPPIAQYTHAYGQSITGGYVYRGAAIPALAGRYVFGDFVSGRIWHIARNTPPTLAVTDGFDSGLSIASFGQGIDGELYVVHYGGLLYRLKTGAGSGGSVPSQLSATGCVAAGDAPRLVSGLIPYAPNAPFWSDGAVKERYLALPNGTTITPTAAGDFEFPNGTVLMKHFRLGGRLVETRLFMRHSDGEWAGYTYEWNAQGTDATRVVGGKTAPVGSQSWVFPERPSASRATRLAAGRSLGLELAQLNGSLLYPQTGRTANQIATLNAIGLFNPAVSTPPSALPALPDPSGASGTLTERARAYLHTNCSHCHRPNGGTPTDLDLRYATALSGTNSCDRPPQAGDLGLTDARIIAPGAAGRSVLVARVNRRDAQAMPPLASNVVDAAGVNLLTQWVNSLSNCIKRRAGLGVADAQHCDRDAHLEQEADECRDQRQHREHEQQRDRRREVERHERAREQKCDDERDQQRRNGAEGDRDVDVARAPGERGQLLADALRIVRLRMAQLLLHVARAVDDACQAVGQHAEKHPDAREQEHRGEGQLIAWAMSTTLIPSMVLAGYILATGVRF